MWYWICSSDKPNAVGFNCDNEAETSKLKAEGICKIRNLKNKDKNIVWYVREDSEHPDKDYKQFVCPACDNLMSSRELDDTWDWAGPHCNQCGCTGMTMFASVTAHKPVMSGKGVFLYQTEKLNETLKKCVETLKFW